MTHGLRPAVHDAQRDLCGGQADGLREVGHVRLEVGGARVELLEEGWGNCINRSFRKIDSQRLFSREWDFPKTLSLTENQFSGRTYFYTIHPGGVHVADRGHPQLHVKLLLRLKRGRDRRQTLLHRRTGVGREAACWTFI